MVVLSWVFFKKKKKKSLQCFVVNHKEQAPAKPGGELQNHRTTTKLKTQRPTTNYHSTRKHNKHDSTRSPITKSYTRKGNFIETQNNYSDIKFTLQQQRPSQDLAKSKWKFWGICRVLSNSWLGFRRDCGEVCAAERCGTETASWSSNSGHDKILRIQFEYCILSTSYITVVSNWLRIRHHTV